MSRTVVRTGSCRKDVFYKGLLLLLCLSGLLLCPFSSEGEETDWNLYMTEGAKAYQNGNEADAETLYLAALDTLKDASPDDPRLATTLNTLAVLYHHQRKFAAATPLYEQVLALLEKTLPAEHPVLAHTLNNLAVVYEAQGNLTKAETLYQRAIPLLERTLGKDHTSVAAALSNYADLLRKMHRDAEAEFYDSRAKSIWDSYRQEQSHK